MSKNCIKCVSNRRNGNDLLCSPCRVEHAHEQDAHASICAMLDGKSNKQIKALIAERPEWKEMFAKCTPADLRGVLADVLWLEDLPLYR